VLIRGNGADRGDQTFDRPRECQQRVLRELYDEKGRGLIVTYLHTYVA